MHEPARGSSPTCTRKLRRAAAKYAPASRWTRFLRRRWENIPSSRLWKWLSSRRNRRAPATRVTRATTPARFAGGARPRRCRWRTTRARCSSGCSAIPEARTRRRGSRASSRIAAFSTRSSRRLLIWSNPSGRAIAASSTSISTRSGTSNAAFRKPRSRATRNCRLSRILPASRPPTTSTRSC